MRCPPRAGERLLASAQRMEQEALEIDETVVGQDAKLSGPLRVAAINNMASSVLMPMFAAFSRQHPAVVLRVIVSNTGLSLSQREGDVTIRLTNTPTDTLIGKRATMIASTIYGSPAYLAERRVQWAAGTLMGLGVECYVFHRT